MCSVAFESWLYRCNKTYNVYIYMIWTQALIINGNLQSVEWAHRCVKGGQHWKFAISPAKKRDINRTWDMKKMLCPPGKYRSHVCHTGQLWMWGLGSKSCLRQKKHVKVCFSTLQVGRQQCCGRYRFMLQGGLDFPKKNHSIVEPKQQKGVWPQKMMLTHRNVEKSHMTHRIVENLTKIFHSVTRKKDEKRIWPTKSWSKLHSPPEKCHSRQPVRCRHPSCARAAFISTSIWAWENPGIGHATAHQKQTTTLVNIQKNMENHNF